MDNFTNKLDVYKAVEKNANGCEEKYYFKYKGWKYMYDYVTEYYNIKIWFLWVEIEF